MFDLATYPALAARTEKQLPTALERLEHSALGLVTETGEIATIVKRIAIYGKSLDDLNKDGQTTLRDHLKEEMGDVLWYMPMITREFGASDIYGSVTPEHQEGIEAIPFLLALTSVSRRLSTQAGAVAEIVEEAACAKMRGEDAYAVIKSQWEELAECHAELFVGLKNLAYLIGADLRDIAGANIAKLQARYPEKYTDQAAEARADKGGEDARNS